MTNTPETPSYTVVEPENALPAATFDSLHELCRAGAARAGWTDLMPVQARAIPYLLAGRDLMIQSHTGSGKTGAFLLPALARIDLTRPASQVLVLVPTRELARQVSAEAEILSGDPKLVAAVYGGTAYEPQVEALRRGAPIVVGTPGRILDHLLQRTLSLADLSILVLDEADRMLSMGFYPDMKKVQRYLPREGRSTYLFSATFPPFVLRLAREFLRQPEVLSLSRDRIHALEVEHAFYTVPPMDKDRALVRIIEEENPSAAIIFCNTKVKVHYVTTVLQRFGYDADQLSSDLTQAARDRVMERLRRRRLRFLVATDVAARGIDVPELSHAIQYEPPDDPEAYVHRAGRTGRAGASGEAISLVTPFEKILLQNIAKQFKIELIERKLPSDEDVQSIVSQRLTALLEAQLRDRDKLQVERMRRFLPLARQLAGEEDELSVVAMLLDDHYQKSLHSSAGEPAEEAPAAPHSAVDPHASDRPPRKRFGRRRR